MMHAVCEQVALLEWAACGSYEVEHELLIDNG